MNNDKKSRSCGDLVRLGREIGTITEILDQGQVRVRLESGRVLKIDTRLLIDAPAEDINVSSKSIDAPTENKAVPGPRRTKSRVQAAGDRSDDKTRESDHSKTRESADSNPKGGK